MRSEHLSDKKKKADAEELVRLWLKNLADFDYRHPKIIVACSIVLFLISVAYTALFLTFDADQANLIKRSSALQANQDLYIESFPKAEDMVVVVEDGTEEDRRNFVESLGSRLKEEPDTFCDIFYKADLSQLGRHALQFLDAEQLKETAELLKDNKKLICKLAESKSLADILEIADKDSRSKKSSVNFESMLPAVNGFTDLFSDCILNRGRTRLKSPWHAVLAGNEELKENADIISDFLERGQAAQYSCVGNGRFYILLCRPVYKENEDPQACAQKAVFRMRQILEEMEKSHTEVLVGLTGEVVLNCDEAESSSNDSVMSAVWSLILISIVFIWAFKECWRPLMAVCGLVIGLGWTMGFTTLVIGHLNLLTVTFTTILMGLGIDFGIHFIYRYDEERHKTNSDLKAMRITLIGAGYENLTGAVSTALAFYVLAFTDFTGIAELGIIAGSGILFCLASMSLVLPSLIFIYEKKKYASESGSAVSQYKLLADAERWMLKNCEAVVAFGAALTIVCFFFGRAVKYDYNLLNLQAKGLESVNTELHLLNSSEHSLLCGISLAKTPEEACDLAERFSKLPSVSSCETVAFMIPRDFEDKRESLQSISNSVSPIPKIEAFGRSANLSRIEEFKRMGAVFEKHGDEASDILGVMSKSSDPKTASEAKKLKAKLDKLFEAMSSMGPGAIENGIDSFERIFFNTLHRTLLFLNNQVYDSAFTINDIPEDLRKREIGRSGLIQVRVFPKENVWVREAQERFVKDIQSVDPNAVGMPVMAYYDCQELRESNEKAGVWALAAIWILLFAHFRKVSTAVLALMPKVLGIIWMVGLMGVLHADFNSANFLALPLILGIGLVFGIHILHRVSEEDGSGIFGHSTGPSITLAAVTTMIGFATMINADHQGVASLGLVMTLGVGTNLLSSAVFMPSFFAFMRKYFNYNVKLHK